MSESYVVGVDLGGTTILTAAADLEGNIITKCKVATEAKKGKDRIINIKRTIYNVLEEANINIKDVKGIGLGSPGPLDVKKRNYC